LIGINQIVWEPAVTTLHVESDEQLEEATTYLLVVTRGIRGSDGAPLRAMSFPHDHDDDGETGATSTGRTCPKACTWRRPATRSGRTSPRRASSRRSRSGRSRGRSGASSKTASQIFVLGTGGERTVFPLATLSSVTWSRQISTAPAFSTGALVLPLLAGVGTVAFGTYESPDYEDAARVIPAVGTQTGRPQPQRTNDVQFSLFLPAGTTPVGGWPVAIFGHGFGDWKNGAPSGPRWRVGASRDGDRRDQCRRPRRRPSRDVHD
jgi:hypothetical protein